MAFWNCEREGTWSLMSRPKHPRKELEAVLKEAERKNWTVVKTTYYKMRCPCPAKHSKTVRLTPSGSRYLKNLLGQLARATCWEDDA